MSDLDNANLHIERYDATNDRWVPVGDGPMPFYFKDSPQTLPLEVWKAYVVYMNVRESVRVLEENEPSSRYRLSRYTTTTNREVLEG